MEPSNAKHDRFSALCEEARKHFSENRFREAIAAYQAALSENPKAEKVVHNLGVLYRKTGQLEKARVLFQRALSRNPERPEFLNNLAALKIDAGEHEAAEPLLEKVLSRNPDSLDALYNMGLVRQKSGNLDAAHELFERVIQKKPHSAEAYHNLGAVQIKRGELEAAEDCFRKALEINPRYEKVRVDQALILLLKGKLKEGFDRYEHRYGLGGGRMEKRLSPLWDGRPIPGKTLLVAFEQGLGDSLQFARYLPLAREKCGNLIFQCQKPLHPLLVEILGAENVRETVKKSEFDFGISLLSLPRLLGTDRPERIPAFTPYLSSPPDRTETWKKKISQHSWNVGLVWAGNPQHQNDWNRSLHLRDFSLLVGSRDLQFHALQIGHRSEEALSPPEGMNLANWGPEIQDFSDTAAIVHHLDLVISVDTSVAHLAGAMGKPTWLLLPYIPDWRWMLAGETTPWYPSMRLYRQPSLGDWESVFLKLKRDFAKTLRPPEEIVFPTDPPKNLSPKARGARETAEAGSRKGKIMTGSEGKNFFFVTGIPRSGTTWLQMLLDAHPDLHCRPEDFFSFFTDQIPGLLDGYNQRLALFQRRTNERQPLHRLEEKDGRAIFRFIVGHILNKAFSDPSVLRSGANDNEIIHHFQLYNALFPASRFVVILRDPRDVAISSWYINRQTSSSFSRQYPSLPIWAAHIRRGWIDHVRKVQRARQAAGNRLTTLRYEDLRQDTSQWVSALLNFLEVRNDEKIRTECIEKTRFSRLTGGRKAGVEDSADFFRKGIVGDWKNHLDEETRAAFLQEAGPEMDWLQYR